MNDDEFRTMRINVILFFIGAVILALDLFTGDPNELTRRALV
jgi:hypothetical protein